MLHEAGPVLDREIARRLREKNRPPPPYSTDSRTADRLIARLERSGIFVGCSEAGPFWHCSLSASVAGRRERMATGTGGTRQLALCRAVVNLPEDRVLPEEETTATT